MDIIVDGVALLNKIGLQPTDQPLHHDYIENAEQLAQSFAYFFAPGAASEWVNMSHIQTESEWAHIGISPEAI